MTRTSQLKQWPDRPDDFIAIFVWGMALDLDWSKITALPESSDCGLAFGRLSVSGFGGDMGAISYLSSSGVGKKHLNEFRQAV